LNCWWWNCMFIICENGYIVNCALIVELCYVVVDLWWDSCLTDVVVVMRYCCWWFITWVLIIIGLWCELSCCWWFLWKWVDLVNHVEMALFSCLMCFWNPFWVHKPVNNLWKHIWVFGNQNWGFWVKKGKNPRVFVQYWWLYA